MKRVAPVLVVLVSITVLAGVALVVRPSTDVAPFPRGGLVLPISLPSGDFMSDQVERLALEATQPIVPVVSNPPTSPAQIVPETETPTVAAIPPAATGAESSPPEPIQPAPETAALSDADERQAAYDRAVLEARNSELAFVDISGEISGKKIAVFHFIESGEKKTAIEGAEVNSLKLAAVSDDSVQLGYGKAEPITKPRIQLEVEEDPNQVLTDEEKQARLVRYQELWGNRFMVAARESGADVRASNLSEPPDAEQQAARRKYWETYQEFFEKVRAQDPSVDPREIPRPDLDPDIAVKKYFETHWPGHVEVTTEPATGESP